MATLGVVRVSRSIKPKKCAYCPSLIEQGEIYLITFLKAGPKFWSNPYHMNCLPKYALERYGKPSKNKRTFKDPERKKLLRKRQYLLDQLVKETDEIRIKMYNDKLMELRSQLGAIDNKKQTRLSQERIRAIVEKQRI